MSHYLGWIENKVHAKSTTQSSFSTWIDRQLICVWKNSTTRGLTLAAISQWLASDLWKVHEIYNLYPHYFPMKPIGEIFPCHVCGWGFDLCARALFPVCFQPGQGHPEMWGCLLNLSIVIWHCPHDESHWYCLMIMVMKMVMICNDLSEGNDKY